MDGGDGRLDLDDLGEVIDRASSLTATPSTELLDDGRGRTWGDRLEAAGITPWLRRHRVAIASLTAVVVLAGLGLTAYASSRPPELDPTMRVTVTDTAPTAQVTDDGNGNPVLLESVGIFDSDGSGVRRTAYALTPGDDADTSTYEVLGLLGPGIRATRVRPHPRPTTGQPFANDVDVVLDCHQASVLRAKPDDYQVMIGRTDALGRTVTARVPTPDEGVSWSSYIRSMCFQEQALSALTVRSVVATPDLTSRTVALSVTIDNALTEPAIVSRARSGGFPPVVAILDPRSLPPVATSVLPLRLQVASCPEARTGYISASDGTGRRWGYSVLGTYLSLALDASLGDGQVTAPLRWSPDQARTIDAALAATCVGAPAASVAIDDARIAPSGPQGDPSTTTFTTTMTVRTSGTAVRVGTPQRAEDEFPSSSFSQAVARVADGRAVLPVLWAVDCSNGFVEPPWVRVEVTTPRGSYPSQIQLPSPVLATALTAACPSIPPDQLESFGWPPDAVRAASTP